MDYVWSANTRQSLHSTGPIGKLRQNYQDGLQSETKQTQGSKLNPEHTRIKMTQYLVNLNFYVVYVLQ